MRTFVVIHVNVHPAAKRSTARQCWGHFDRNWRTDRTQPLVQLCLRWIAPKPHYRHPFSQCRCNGLWRHQLWPPRLQVQRQEEMKSCRAISEVTHATWATHCAKQSSHFSNTSRRAEWPRIISTSQRPTQQQQTVTTALYIKLKAEIAERHAMGACCATHKRTTKNACVQVQT
jgi:hypothetical protein